MLNRSRSSRPAMISALVVSLFLGTSIIAIPLMRIDSVGNWRRPIRLEWETSPARCPICGGELVTVGSLVDDESLPSKNIDVWNRSSCGNTSYLDNSMICAKCWFARSNRAYPGMLEEWNRSSEEPDTFHLPLAADIRQFPVPPESSLRSIVFFQQKLRGDQWSDSIHFWIRKGTASFEEFRDYCEAHDLSISRYIPTSMEGESSVTISTSPRQFADVKQAAEPNP